MEEKKSEIQMTEEEFPSPEEVLLEKRRLMTHREAKISVSMILLILLMTAAAAVLVLLLVGVLNFIDLEQFIENALELM